MSFIVALPDSVAALIFSNFLTATSVCQFDTAVRCDKKKLLMFDDLIATPFFTIKCLSSTPTNFLQSRVSMGCLKWVSARKIRLLHLDVDDKTIDFDFGTIVTDSIERVNFTLTDEIETSQMSFNIVNILALCSKMNQFSVINYYRWYQMKPSDEHYITSNIPKNVTELHLSYNLSEQAVINVASTCENLIVLKLNSSPFETISRKAFHNLVNRCQQLQSIEAACSNSLTAQDLDQFLEVNKSLKEVCFMKSTRISNIEVDNIFLKHKNRIHTLKTCEYHINAANKNAILIHMSDLSCYSDDGGVFPSINANADIVMNAGKVHGKQCVKLTVSYFRNVNVNINIRSVCAYFTELRSLSLYSKFEKTQPAVFLLIAKSCKLLEKIDIYCCQLITDLDLLTFIQLGLSLKDVRIYHCDRLTNNHVLTEWNDRVCHLKGENQLELLQKLGF